MDHVKSFLSSANKGDSTEVCSETAPEVVQEHVTPHQTVEQVEAIDRERHIHHHQHRVQPVKDQQVLPTKEEFNVLPETVRESKHDMLPEHREKLEQQRKAYVDTQTVSGTVRHEGAAAAVANEHVHHHVHETIQPVVQRETVAPTTVHTTIPVHERVHDAPIVHEATTLPTVTLDEFKNKVGAPHLHNDNNHHHQFYEGAPRVGGGANTTSSQTTTGNNTTGTGHTGIGHNSSTQTGTTGTNVGKSSTGTTGTGIGKSGTGSTGLTGTGHSSTGSTGLTGTGHSSTGATGTTGTGHSSSTGTTGTGIGSKAI